MVQALLERLHETSVYMGIESCNLSLSESDVSVLLDQESTHSWSWLRTNVAKSIVRNRAEKGRIARNTFTLIGTLVGTEACSAWGDIMDVAIIVSAIFSRVSCVGLRRLYHPCFLVVVSCTSVTVLVDISCWALLPRRRHPLTREANCDVKLETPSCHAPPIIGKCSLIT